MKADRTQRMYEWSSLAPPASTMPRHSSGYGVRGSHLLTGLSCPPTQGQQHAALRQTLCPQTELSTWDQLPVKLP